MKPKQKNLQRRPQRRKLLKRLNRRNMRNISQNKDV
jgi:hypothetical protein